MIFGDLDFWLIVLMISSLVLFLETAVLVRSLAVSRKASWRYSIVAIPLAVSIWSLLVLMNIYNVYSMLPPRGIHWDFALYYRVHMTIEDAVRMCQVQVGIAAGVFMFVLLLERVLGLKYVPSASSQSSYLSPAAMYQAVMHQNEQNGYARARHRLY
ncbi:MAG TPA: hypothetical protein VJ761_11915 [Ktedonobacteraceae bacterium]|nr:hypothetical protein [Ktedonobacteraceae bacterium]